MRKTDQVTLFPPHLQVKPFIKWAGGKGQLVNYIHGKYPSELGKSINKYAEPFIGAGAILFDILNNFILDSIYVSDTNKELINLYLIIKNNVIQLIDNLKLLQNDYISKDTEQRKIYYYEKRDIYNSLITCHTSQNSIEKAALFIFLNRTCFNGLYRVNARGLFNVPMGAYKNPTICDEDNLINVSKVLGKVQIICADYRESANFIDEHTFVYFDPPYRPLTTTANFNSYTELDFNDDSQRELSHFAASMSERNAKIMVSNSDPKNSDPNDNFFDNLYSQFKISRIPAKRLINRNSAQRGTINELLICNY